MAKKKPEPKKPAKRPAKKPAAEVAPPVEEKRPKFGLTPNGILDICRDRGVQLRADRQPDGSHKLIVKSLNGAMTPHLRGALTMYHDAIIPLILSGANSQPRGQFDAEAEAWLRELYKRNLAIRPNGQGGWTLKYGGQKPDPGFLNWLADKKDRLIAHLYPDWGNPDPPHMNILMRNREGTIFTRSLEPGHYPYDGKPSWDIVGWRYLLHDGDPPADVWRLVWGKYHENWQGRMFFVPFGTPEGKGEEVDRV